MSVKVKQTLTSKHLTEITEYESPEARLPYWARSTNPIVRRHLGLYWRTVPPELQPFVVIYAVWVVLMLIGIIAPPLFAFAMISFLASIMIIPFAMLLYGHVLLSIAIEAAKTMQQEMTNDTFQLLRATPMSLSQIFMGKVAAALWKRMDDIVMVGQLALAFSPPILFTVYSYVWSPNGEVSSFAAPIMTLIGTLVVLYRVIAEPIMIGVMSVFIGLVVSGRSRAISTAVVLGAFYFLLLNLVSQLPMIRGYELADKTVALPNTNLIVLIDFILPVILPVIISLSLLKLGENIISKD